ncbi:MAG TPA: hypothetical protein DIT49_07075 [Clostridiales bacterium]|nr:hypothetical protein [Clostridiales bacterium]
MSDFQNHQSGGQGYHYDPQPGPGFSSGGYHYDPAPGSGGPNHSNNSSSWMKILILYGLGCIGIVPCLFIAIYLTLKKVYFNQSEQQKAYYRSKVRAAGYEMKGFAQNLAREIRQEVDRAQRRNQAQQGQPGQSQQTQHTAAPSAGAKGAQKRDTQWKQGAADAQSPPFSQEEARAASYRSLRDRLRRGTGRGRIVLGGILAGLLSIPTMAQLAELLQDGWHDLDEFPVLVVLLAASLGLIYSGVRQGQRSQRFLAYLDYIGTNQEIDLTRMAAAFDIRMKKLCKDLRQMLAQGVLPSGYLDLAEGKLYLSTTGYRGEDQAEAEEQPEPEFAGQPQQAGEDDEILREIRQVNQAIPNPAMSAKIHRIEEITRRILDYQQSHPAKASQLRTFLNYYLPTTLKILRSYAQLDAQGVEGANISATKARIEGMMDRLVSAFEAQLDRLFQDEALDISADVAVLEQMLKKDGLSDEDGVNLTM